MAVLLLLPLVTVAMSAAKKKTVTWQQAGMMYKNAKELSVTKVELTDTATTLYMHVEYRPKYWIRIAAGCFLQDLQGGRFALKAADGIKPGEKFYMPESGEHDFTLRFEPLPNGTKMFDLLESEKEGDWRIFGIHDKATQQDLGIPDKLLNMKYSDNETLPVIRYSPGNVKVRFKAYGYRPEMKAMVMATPGGNLGDRERKSVEVPLNDDGTAVFDVYVTHTSMIFVSIPGHGTAVVLVVPGEEVSLAMDLSKANSDEAFFGFTGMLARTGSEVTRFKFGLDNVYDDSVMVDSMEGRTTDECLEFLNKALRENLRKIDSMEDLTDATKQVLRFTAEWENFEWRCYFDRQWEQAKIKLANVRMAQEYEELRKNMTTPAVDTDVLTKGMPEMECMNSDQAMLFLTSQNVYSLSWPINNDYNRQVVTLNTYLKGFAIIDDEAIDSVVTDETLRGLLADKRIKDRQMQEELARLGNVFYHTHDNIAPEDILPTILKRHEGKAVLVDLWETWCAPCRRGHEQMKPLKEELKDKNVVFVYLASPSSPSGTWKEMMENISGEHYYLTLEQQVYIKNKYESQGIPTYLLFDTNGELSFKRVGLTSNDVFRTEIEKAMRRQ